MKLCQLLSEHLRVTRCQHLTAAIHRSAALAVAAMVMALTGCNSEAESEAVAEFSCGQCVADATRCHGGGGSGRWGWDGNVAAASPPPVFRVWYRSFASSSLSLNYLICHGFEALLTTQTRPDDHFCAALSVFRGLGRLPRHVIHEIKMQFN